jgi:serine/threonine protein kinase
MRKASGKPRAKRAAQQKPAALAPLPLPETPPVGLLGGSLLPFLSVMRGVPVGKGKFGQVEAYDAPPELAEEVQAAADALGLTVKSVAVKFALDSSGAPAPDALREVRYLSVLSHPNVLRLLECFRYPRIFGSISPLAQGSLYALREQLSLRQVKACVLQLLRGLEYVHAQAIVHSDVKPGNTLVYLSAAPDGVPRAVLADFGASHEEGQCRDGSSLKQDRAYTPRYRAPEGFLGALTTYASDVWSAVVTAHDIATKSQLLSPTDPKDNKTVLFAQATLLGTPTEATWPDVSRLPLWRQKFGSGERAHVVKGSWDTRVVEPGLKAFVSRALIMNPAVRATARELAADPWLEEARQDVGPDPIIQSRYCEDILASEQARVRRGTPSVEPSESELLALGPRNVAIITAENQAPANPRTRALILSLAQRAFSRGALAPESQPHTPGELQRRWKRVAFCALYVAMSLLEQDVVVSDLFGDVSVSSSLGRDLGPFLASLGVRDLGSWTSYDALWLIGRARYPVEVRSVAKSLLSLFSLLRVSEYHSPLVQAWTCVLIACKGESVPFVEAEHGATHEEVKDCIRVAYADMRRTLFYTLEPFASNGRLQRALHTLPLSLEEGLPP